MPKITVRNNRRHPIAFARTLIQPGKEETIQVDEADLRRLSAKRGLVQVEKKSSKSAADTPAWGSTVDEAIAYVGDDQTKALEVLTAEEAKGDKARKSLVEKLGPIAAGEES